MVAFLGVEGKYAFWNAGKLELNRFSMRYQPPMMLVWGTEKMRFGTSKTPKITFLNMPLTPGNTHSCNTSPKVLQK